VNRPLPRHLHPGAWWVWAIALGAAALRTRNPILLMLLVAVAWYVVAARRTEAPWARSFSSFVRLGVVIMVIRLVLQVLFAARVPGHTIFTLPEANLPSWAAGVSVGGPVTVEAMLAATYEGLQLAVLLAAVGAANSLASPYRLLRCLPAVLYEAGVAVTVAFSFAPQATSAAGRLREARRLRGRAHRGIRSWRGVAVPVLEGALERSVHLAASMDSRGYGRRAMVRDRDRRATNLLTAGGFLAVLVGAYGLLDAGTPAGLGLPMLAAGSALLAASIAMGARRSTRTRYRADPWRGSEWTVALAGVAVLAAVVVAGRLGVDGLQPSIYPLEAPALPLLPALGIAVGLLPAVTAPRPPVAVGTPRVAAA
jgi:energy-coupling factor transport system permease protein